MFRNERLSNQIREQSAEFFKKEASHASLITVTHCDIDDHEKNAIVFISVLPESKENAAIGFAKRNRKSLREFVRKNISSQIPYLDVQIDLGEKNRQKIERILKETGDSL